ncbi:MAG TPA: hypothetical protein VGN17_20270 [Bryobacteraceae bacterium]
MADFRRWIYALAVVALLAGFTVPVSAQAPPFQCIANAGVPPIVRGEGYTELVGDLTLNCTGGVPTPAGQAVPPVNFTVLLNTNITSRLLAVNLFNEALLIVDEPHSAVQPTRNILNCGNTGAPDTGFSGPGVCSIISIGDPANTYNGNPNRSWSTTALADAACGSAGTLASNSYGCGRPNVFQGRTGSQQNANQFNSVTWLGVPLDPPGTTTNRTLRFTNIRANANFLGVSTTFTTNYIQAQISVNGNTSLSINNPQQIVAFVQKGLIAGVSKTNFTFLQCNSENPGPFATGFSATTITNTGGTPAYTFTEGFASSWKAKNIAMITSQAGNGVFQNASNYWQYNQANPILYPPDQNQNVPGAIYNTESGFEYPANATGVVDPAAPNNPPNGVGTTPVTSTANALNSVYNTSVSGLPQGTNIQGAGIANQGTRLAIQLSSIPTGSIVLVPQVVYLSNITSQFGGISVGAIRSGVMVLTNTDANGAGSYSPPTTPLSTNYQAVPSNGLVVYEVLFADPFSIESATVPLVVAYAANLAQNLPQPGVTAQAAGGFAPFYSTAAAQAPSSSLPIPRFTTQQTSFTPQDLFRISKCACNMLFPYVVSAGGYDTGIAISNTSLDPGGSFGFGATPQSGVIQFWYYNSAATTAPPATQTSSSVPAGGVLTYVLSQNNPTWNLDNRAAGFVGYIIAQAQFQYCHAFAFIGALGGGNALVNGGLSEGYLGLILDNTGINCDPKGDSGNGLCRTTQRGENLVH